VTAPPQSQFFVNDGLQYAALAKCVNGANPAICVELSVVMSRRLTLTAAAWTSSTEARAKRDKNRTITPGGKKAIYMQHGINARAYVPVTGSLQPERGKVGHECCSLVKGTKTNTIKALYSGATRTTMRCYNSPCLSVSRNIEFQTKSYAVIGACYISVSICAY
jgi:hypothetical protein